MGKLHVAMIHILLKGGFGVFKIKCYAKINSFPKLFLPPKTWCPSALALHFLCHTLWFSPSEINPPWGSRYPGHLPPDLDIYAYACKLQHITGRLSFRRAGVPAGSLCTQQARHPGTAQDGAASIWTEGLYQNHLPVGVKYISKISFPSLEKRRRKKSSKLFPVELHANTFFQVLGIVYIFTSPFMCMWVWVCVCWSGGLSLLTFSQLSEWEPSLAY